MLAMFKNRRLRKQCHELCRHARHLLHMRGDLMTEEECATLTDRIEGLRMAIKTGDPEDMSASANSLEASVMALTPVHAFSGLRENIEVLVVALAVAMAFRAYFFQPFKIPTGSMQPTLYGIYGVTEPAGTLDSLPLMPFKWIVTGGRHRTVTAKASGTISFSRDPRQYRPGYHSVVVGGQLHRIPTHIRNSPSYAIRIGEQVRVGDVLWEGTVYSGDHVFVNRLAWNWRKPRRGDVMVFETRGIPGLPQGTHYIKRMVGLPGEAISIDPPYLKVNGEAVTEPPSIKKIVDRAHVSEYEAYLGYRLVDRHTPASELDSKTALLTVEDTFVLGEDEYFACGDNTANSKDSRYWGAAPQRNLVGPAAVVYWPISRRWGLIR